MQQGVLPPELATAVARTFDWAADQVVTEGCFLELLVPVPPNDYHSLDFMRAFRRAWLTLHEHEHAEADGGGYNDANPNDSSWLFEEGEGPEEDGPAGFEIELPSRPCSAPPALDRRRSQAARNKEPKPRRPPPAPRAVVARRQAPAEENACEAPVASSLAESRPRSASSANILSLSPHPKGPPEQAPPESDEEFDIPPACLEFETGQEAVFATANGGDAAASHVPLPTPPPVTDEELSCDEAIPPPGPPPPEEAEEAVEEIGASASVLIPPTPAPVPEEVAHVGIGGSDGRAGAESVEHPEEEEASYEDEAFEEMEDDGDVSEDLAANGSQDEVSYDEFVVRSQEQSMNAGSISERSPGQHRSRPISASIGSSIPEG